MLDTEGRVENWNSAAQRIKGYSEKEIIGQHFSLFYPRGDIECGKPQRDLDIVIAEERFEDEGWRVRKDSSIFWANVVITTMRDAGGKLCGFVNRFCSIVASWFTATNVDSNFKNRADSQSRLVSTGANH